MKNRIVINLDQPARGQVRSSFNPPPPNKQKRRWPRILALFATFFMLIVVAVLGALYLWWRNFQTSPAYSMALIVDAAQRDDMPGLESRLDDEALVTNIVAAVRTKAGSRYGVALSDSLQRRIDGTLPILVPQLKQTIHTEVAKEIKEFSSSAASKPFVFIALEISSLVTITTEGDNARAVVRLPDRVVQATLKRDGRLWKVVDFKDEALVQRLVDGIMKDLPAIGGSDLGPLGNLPNRSRRRGRRR